MKIDCSKTENYLKEKGRMLESIKADCSYCILASAHNGTGFFCCIFECKHPDKAISVIQNWSDEHPQKTYLDDFREKFPKARVEDNYICCGLCVADLYSINVDICNQSESECIRCWNSTMEE